MATTIWAMEGLRRKKEDLGYFGDRDGELSLVKDVRRLTLYGKKEIQRKAAVPSGP